MKWNWIKDGGPSPKPYKDVLCHCAFHEDGDPGYTFVGYWSDVNGKYHKGMDWAVSHTGEWVNTPDAWCYIESPVKPYEDE